LGKCSYSEKGITMAKGFKGKRPEYNIAPSIFVRKGKYISGPSFGLWTNDKGGPMARGSVKDDYLQELAEFLLKAAKREQSVSFALFKNKKRVEEDDDSDSEEDSEDDDFDSDSEEDEEEERPARKKKSTKKSSGKKKDWDFDSDEDDD